MEFSVSSKMFEFSPPGGHFLRRGIAVPKKHLKLLGEQRPSSAGAFLSLWPPTESTLTEPFLTEPKALTVINEGLERCGRLIAKDEHTAAEGVLSEHLTADPTQAIDAFPEVLRLHRHQESHLRRDLDHDFPLKKPRIIATGSGWRL